MKIEAYAVEEETIHLTMQGGGKLSLPITRIERIVDDEIITAEVVEEVRKIVEEGGSSRGARGGSARAASRSSSRNTTRSSSRPSRQFDVDAALVSAVIKAESDYNPRIVSNKGARGLMQLMPATAERFGVANSFDPRENIHGGTRYLRWLLKKFDGNADLAVAAYNAGEGNVWKYKGVPPFRETVNYINRIAKHIRRAIETEVIPRDRRKHGPRCGRLGWTLGRSAHPLLTQA